MKDIVFRIKVLAVRLLWPYTRLRRALTGPRMLWRYRTPEGFYVNIKECGNTVSSTIPIALKRALEEGILKPGHRVMLVGFGVGYSWAATMITWAGQG